jgi:hypothetical protein
MISLNFKDFYGKEQFTKAANFFYNTFQFYSEQKFWEAEVYAIKACAVENLDTDYRNRNIYILPDSQAAIKALSKYQITSKLVWDCHQSLTELARHNSSTDMSARSCRYCW